MFDLFENVIDLAQSKKTGGKLPFGETPRGTENLFKGITEYPNFDNGEGSGIFFLKDPKLNLYKSYDIIIRGDVYANVPCEKTHNYYDFAVWGDMSFSKYPFALEASWIDQYNPIWDEDGNWVGAYGNVAYWAYPQIVVDTTKYPDLKPEEIEIYEPASITKMSGKFVEGMGWSEKETVTVIPEQTITLKALSNTVAAENAFFVGDKVVVKWNGDIYECVAVSLQGLAAVGNASLADMGEPSSEPFLIGSRGENAVIFAGEQGETSVCVNAITETIHPIDQKFLPSGVGGTKLYHDSYNGKTYTDEQLAIELVFSDAVKVELPVTIALYSQGSFTGAEVSVVAKMVQDTTAYFYYVVPTDESGGFEMLSVTVRDKSGPM